MTLKQFDNQKWGANMKARYDGAEYWVRSVNFNEQLLELQFEFLDPYKDDDGLIWVRCENVELIEDFTVSMPVLNSEQIVQVSDTTEDDSSK